MQLCLNSCLKALSALFGGSIGLLHTFGHIEESALEKLFSQVMLRSNIIILAKSLGFKISYLRQKEMVLTTMNSIRILIYGSISILKLGGWLMSSQEFSLIWRHKLIPFYLNKVKNSSSQKYKTLMTVSYMYILERLNLALERMSFFGWMTRFLKKQMSQKSGSDGPHSTTLSRMSNS